MFLLLKFTKNTSESLLMIGCFGYLRYWGISDIIDVR